MKILLVSFSSVFLSIICLSYIEFYINYYNLSAIILNIGKLIVLTNIIFLYIEQCLK